MTFEKDGVSGLMSAGGFKVAWTDYQTLLVHKLNELTTGEPIEDNDALTLTKMFARDPMNASLFNHASSAYNNHFFFSTLSPHPHELEKKPALQTSLKRTFGSVETLRMTMLDTAAAMFGPGYVWLLWASEPAGSSAGRIAGRSGHWRILTTYLSGTPYPEAGYRQQGLNMATNNAVSYQQYLDSLPVNPVAAFGPYSQDGREAAKYPPGGTKVTAVLCLSTWEHTYIYDYGLMGKRKYLEDWWNAVDWDLVNKNAPTEALEMTEFVRN